jgi:chromosome segregation ATPase
MVECLVDFNHALISKMALERQAKQLSANYETLLEEKLKAEKNIMNARKASSSHSPGPSDENIAENTKLSKRIAQLEHDLENSTRVLNSQKTEIENLQKQKKSLQKQLDDYEFMFGDARKKNQ